MSFGGAQYGGNMSGINTKLFVGGLNYNTSEMELAAFFSKFGSVTECVIMKFPDSGESRGFGFVTYSNEQEVSWCLSSLPLTLDGKNVDVKRAQAPTRDGTKVGGGIRDGVKRKGGDANCKVFVGGLNYTTQDDMLKQVFSRYGKVNDWIIMKFPDSGESRGFGFVTFSCPEEVERCLINQPIIVDGKSVDIKKAEPPSARAPYDNKRGKKPGQYKHKEMESSIENKMPKGGGTMASICSGGNQCGGGFGNNCGHDTFSTIASQVVAMTTNSHKQAEVVQEETQDYSAYYLEYSKWYASWRQYNDYIQSVNAGSGANKQAPPLPPGERPKTPPQQKSAAATQPEAEKEKQSSIKAAPQYNQEYYARYAEYYARMGHQTQQTADQYNQQISAQYQAIDYLKAGQGSAQNQAGQGGAQYEAGQSSSQYQAGQSSAGAQREISNPRRSEERPRKRRSDDDAYNNGFQGLSESQYIVPRPPPGYGIDGNRSNDGPGCSKDGNRSGHSKEENTYTYDDTPAPYRHYDNNDGPGYGRDENRSKDGSRYGNDGNSYNNECSGFSFDASRYNNDGPSYNRDGPRFNNAGQRFNRGRRGLSNSDNDGPWPRNQNNGFGGDNFGDEHGEAGGGSFGDNGVGGGVEPEKNENYYHNLETMKRKKMRMSS